MCKVVMEPVISDRGILHVYDGHLYTTSRIHNSATVYSRCRIPSCNSRATFLVDKPNDVHVTIPHNHEADEVEVEILRFKAELKRRAVVDSRSPRELFDDVSQQYPRAAKRVGFTALRATLYRYRQVRRPPLPSSLLEFGAILESEEWNHLGRTLVVGTERRNVVDGEQDS